MKNYQSASSLLLTTVTIAAVSVVLLAGAAAFIAAARQQAAQTSFTQASWFAKSAIREGIGRVAKGNGLSPSGEYGIVASGAAQVTTPFVRGFQAGTDCLQYIVDNGAGPSTPGDANCPLQEMSIRRLVTIRQDGSGQALYGLQKQDLPAGVSIVLPIVPQSGLTTNPLLQFTKVNSLTGLVYQLCTSATDDASCASPVPMPGVSFVTNSDTMRVKIIADGYVGNADATEEVLRVRSVGDSVYTIGKGFTTVDATGLMPDGIESRYLAIIRPSGTVVRARTDAFTPDGLCSPNPTGCR